MNINLLNENSAREHIMNFMQSFYLVPWTTRQTRFSSNNSETPSLLDQIRTNFVDNATTRLLSIYITHHCPIFCIFLLLIKYIKTTKLKLLSVTERTSDFMDASADWDFSDIKASDPPTFVDGFLVIIMNTTIKNFSFCS